MKKFFDHHRRCAPGARERSDRSPEGGAFFWDYLVKKLFKGNLENENSHEEKFWFIFIR